MLTLVCFVGLLGSGLAYTLDFQRQNASLTEAKRYVGTCAVAPNATIKADYIGASCNWGMYKQCGESWSDDTLGTASGVTICDAGCAMSSVAMMLQHWGKTYNPGITLSKFFFF